MPKLQSSTRLFAIAAGFLAALLLIPSSTAVAQDQITGVLAGRLLDMEIVTTNGEDIGEIENVIFDKNGKIQQFIVDVGGFLGIGDREVAVSTQELKYNTGEGYAVYQGTRNELQNKPEVDIYAYGRYPYGYGYGSPYPYAYYRDPYYYGPYPTHPYPPRGYYPPRDAYGRYDRMQGDMRGQGREDMRRQGRMDMRGQGREDMRRQGRMDMRGQGREDMRRQGRMDMRGQGREDMRRQGRADMRGQRSEEQRQDRRDQVQGDQERMQRGDRRYYERGYMARLEGQNLLLSAVMDADILNERGEVIGEVENLVISPRGRITHAIAETGGFWDIGDEEVVVKFDQLENVGPYFVMYPGTQEQLENLPQFDEVQFVDQLGEAAAEIEQETEAAAQQAESAAKESEREAGRYVNPQD